MRVLVTRPRRDGEETAALLAEKGHQALLAPLLFPKFLDRIAPDLAQVQALLVTSANGVRAFARLSPRRDLPLFAVGPQTAQTARDADFRQVENANGAVDELVALIRKAARPEKGMLLHIHGNPSRGELAARLTHAGFTVRSECLYEMAAAGRLPPEAADALRRQELGAALFFSPRSAEVFRACLSRAQLGADGLLALCISHAAAEALTPLAFREIRVAAQPNQASLLALLA